MKLLFDANLSPKLVNQLQDLFPGSVHLFDLPLPREAEDSVIWSYAKQNGLDIVTADGDDYPPLTSRFGPSTQNNFARKLAISNQSRLRTYSH